MAALQPRIPDPEPEFEHPARADVVARYRRVRAIATEIQQAAVSLVSEDALLQRARRLGAYAPGMGLIDEHPTIMNYIADLLVYTAPPGRSRAIDRLVRSTSYVPGSEESQVLEAMRKARFTIIQVERRHEIAGVIGRNLISDRPSGSSTSGWRNGGRQTWVWRFGFSSRQSSMSRRAWSCRWMPTSFTA